MRRDGSTREDARSRLLAQLPNAEKLEYADIVLDNPGTQAELEVQVFARRFYLEGGCSWRVKWLIPPIGPLPALRTLIWRRVDCCQRSRRRKAVVTTSTVVSRLYDVYEIRCVTISNTAFKSTLLSLPL